MSQGVASDETTSTDSDAAITPRRRTQWRSVAVFCGVTLLLAGAAAGWWLHHLGPPPLGDKLEYSKLVLDRRGRLLRMS